MFDRRSNNIAIFQDTEKLCSSNGELIKAIQESNRNQKVMLEKDSLEEIKGNRFEEPAQIIVSSKRSLEAAGCYRGEKVCVHNFASATNPGGGVTKGSSAQEEAICRCSTLYFNISEAAVVSSYHDAHKRMLREGQMNATYNDDCIYTPEVIVFKSDTSAPELLPQEDWYYVDVITCAAPNLRERPSNGMNPGSGSSPVCLTEQELKALHVKRMSRILSIAKARQEDVMILGAFGCGAFANPPSVVAEAMTEVVDKFRYDFKTIEFAVYCSARDTENYDVFKHRLGKM